MSWQQIKVLTSKPNASKDFRGRVLFFPGTFFRPYFWNRPEMVGLFKMLILRMVAKSILHRFETMVETIVRCYLQGNRMIPGLLRWCRISSIHSMSGIARIWLGWLRCSFRNPLIFTGCPVLLRAPPRFFFEGVHLVF